MPIRATPNALTQKRVEASRIADERFVPVESETTEPRGETRSWSVRPDRKYRRSVHLLRSFRSQ